MTATTATPQAIEQASDKTAIRPFRVNVPEAELTELRRRIKATRLPEKEPDCSVNRKKQIPPAGSPTSKSILTRKQKMSPIATGIDKEESK